MSIAQDLLTWYHQNKRLLPWRETKNPYYILISEIMLQQTQVDTVIPYYLRFIDRFKTIEDLANASLEEVYKYWQGLGYYSRARNLQTTAQIVIERFDGQMPSQIEDLRTLKGVGPYTANAVGSIAFNQNVFALDGNGLRIVSRLFLIQDNIALPSTAKKIQTLGDELVKEINAGDFNQAIMDLGATICKPKKPLCDTCPIQHHCKAYHHHQQDVLPINIKKKTNKEIHYITGMIRYQNQWMLIKNKESGLLANLYGCIQYEVESPYAFIDAFYEDYHQPLDVIDYIKDIKHVFSHRTWKMHIYLFELHEPNDFLYTKQDIELLPISTAHIKVLQTLI